MKYKNTLTIDDMRNTINGLEYEDYLKVEAIKEQAMNNWTPKTPTDTIILNATRKMFKWFIDAEYSNLTLSAQRKIDAINILLHPEPITDEDRQWADKELRKWFGEKNGR